MISSVNLHSSMLCKYLELSIFLLNSACFCGDLLDACKATSSFSAYDVEVGMALGCIGMLQGVYS